MHNPLITMTDKVMSMIRSMVYLAMRVSHRRGATSLEIADFLDDWAPDVPNSYHVGIVERVLEELRLDGKVTQAGAKWYLAGMGR
jgi:hypothetical protein